MTKPENADEGFDSSDCSPSFRDMYRLTGERVEKREDDAIEYEFIRQAAEDALRLLNGCMDSGMRARGFTKWFRSGNATFRLHLQCVERVENGDD